MRHLAPCRARGATDLDLDVRREVAEAVGAFALVLAGCGAIMADALGGGALGPVGVGLAFGAVVMVMVLALAPVSGAHINPAVTVGLAVAGRFAWARVPRYVAAQLVGATLAAAVLLLLLGPVAGLGTTRLAAGLDAPRGLGFEALATSLLMLVVLAVTASERVPPWACAIGIGGAVLVGALFAGPFTTPGMNPARSIGPALMSGHFDDLWLYIVGPVAGAVAAAGLYGYLRPRPAPAPGDPQQDEVEAQRFGVAGPMGQGSDGQALAPAEEARR